MSYKPKDWVEFLPLVKLAYNAIHSSIKTMYTVCYGFHPPPYLNVSFNRRTCTIFSSYLVPLLHSLLSSTFDLLPSMLYSPLDVQLMIQAHKVRNGVVTTSNVYAYTSDCR